MKKELIVILVACGLFLFWKMGSVSLLDPDEGMYGAIAQEMAEGGDWVTPHFNGVRYLEKPPLYFWLTALTIALFGPSEWTVRAWSAFPALGAVLLVWRLGGLLYGGHAGLLSALVMVSGVGVFHYARVAATDFLLVFSLTLAIYGFVRSCQTRRLADSLLFYLGMALAVLSKGVIGLVLSLAITGFFFCFTPETRAGGLRDSPFAPRRSVPGFLLFLLVALPWHWLAARKNPGFFEFYIVDNQFLRFLNSRAFLEDDVSQTTPAFLLLTLIWFFPWSLFLPAALWQSVSRFSLKSRFGNRLSVVAELWALSVLGFFSFSSSKLEHYFLPAIPALSLMVGNLWNQALRSHAAGLRVCLAVGAIGCLVLGVRLGLFGDRLTSGSLLGGLAQLNVYYRILKAEGVAFPFASVSPFVALMKELGVVLAVGLPVACLLFWFRWPRLSFAVVLGLGGAIFLLVLKLEFIVESHHSARPVALALASRSKPDDPIVYEGSLEYSGGIPFYAHRHVYVLNGKRGDLEFGSRYEEARRLFLDDLQFARLWGSRKPVFLVTRLDRSRSAFRRLPSEQVFLVGQYGPRWLYTNMRTLPD